MKKGAIAVRHCSMLNKHAEVLGIAPSVLHARSAKVPVDILSAAAAENAIVAANIA